MTDGQNHDDQILAQQSAPEHGANFWGDLTASIDSQTQEMTRPIVVTSAKSAGQAESDLDGTAQLPRVTALTSRGNAPAQQARRLWPLAAAAAVLALVGIGFLAARGPAGPSTTTEVVGGTTSDAELSPLDGPTDEGSGDELETTGEPDSISDGGDSVDGEDPDAATTVNAGADADPTPASAPPIPNFERARGAGSEAMVLPLDQGLPEDATFLGTWTERDLSWYAVTSSSSSCADAAYSEIRLVNESGLTQEIRDPQLRFSGEITHLAVQPGQDRAAWVVGCGTQLELYVADLRPTGHVDTLQLVWFGEGSTSSALVIWDGEEVSLNAIEPNGTAFAAAYDLETEIVSRNDGPARILIEAGAPGERSLTPLAASPDAGLTYWSGLAPSGTISACAELYGSGVSDTLWLRQGEGQWQLAVAGDMPLATVTAVAIEHEFNQIALADVCERETGRVLVGDQLPDGRIGDLREIDLTPYVPGYAAQLHWVDADTLRIETDNTEYGFGTVRFDFRLDENIIVQLD